MKSVSMLNLINLLAVLTLHVREIKQIIFPLTWIMYSEL